MKLSMTVKTGGKDRHFITPKLLTMGLFALLQKRYRQS